MDKYLKLSILVNFLISSIELKCMHQDKSSKCIYCSTKNVCFEEKVRILENVHTRTSNEFNYFVPTKCFESDWNRRYVCRRNYSTPQWFLSETFNQYFPYEQ